MELRHSDARLHRQGRLRGIACDDAGSDARNAEGVAEIMAKVELVEGLIEVFRPDCARMRAEQPALQQRDRPVTGLRGVGLALLGFRLKDGLVCARAKACLVFADMTIRGDGGIRGSLTLGGTSASHDVIVRGVAQRLSRLSCSVLVDNGHAPGTKISSCLVRVAHATR